jgi:hypothetical protein
MMQMFKNAMRRTVKMFFAAFKALFKMCILALKVLLITAMLAVMVFGCLSAFLAVGPQHTPSWMAPAWKVLNTLDPVRLSSAIGHYSNGVEALPLWEVRDSSIVISKWVAQMSPVASLLATAAGLAKEHWLRTKVELSLQHMDTLMKSEPKIGQALSGAWIVSTCSVLFLVLRLLATTARLGGRCVRRAVCAVCPARADTSEAAAIAVPPGGMGPTPKYNIPQDTQALGENTSVNIISTTMMTEDKKGGRKRFDSPVSKTIKANMKVSKEDVPQIVASPLRQKHSELNELREQGLVNRRLRGRY